MKLINLIKSKIQSFISSFKEKETVTKEPVSFDSKKEETKHEPISSLKYHVNFGDIFFCKMPLTDEELKQVKKGHRMRPYLVKEVKEDGFIGYYGTSKEQKLNSSKEHWVVLDYRDYDVYKKGNKKGEVAKVDYSYFNLDEEYFIPTKIFFLKQIN